MIKKRHRKGTEILHDGEPNSHFLQRRGRRKWQRAEHLKRGAFHWDVDFAKTPPASRPIISGCYPEGSRSSHPRSFSTRPRMKNSNRNFGGNTTSKCVTSKACIEIGEYRAITFPMNYDALNFWSTVMPYCPTMAP